jgi:hypothetical protein
MRAYKVKTYEDIERDIDLYCMSMCKHNIMSASTFSWWASFLNKNPNKIILYNKVYYYEYLKMFIPI